MSELLAEFRALDAGLNGVTEFFRRNFIAVRQNIFECAKFTHQFSRRLIANASRARNVIGSIARQTFVVDEKFRLKAKFGAKFFLVVNFDAVSFREKHARIFVNQLKSIAVAADDVHEKITRRLSRQRADNIVRLKIFRRQNFNAERVGELFQNPNLRDKFVRSFFAPALVLRINFGAESMAGNVESDGGEVRRVFAQNSQRDIREAGDSAGRDAAGRREIRQGVERAVENVRAVKYCQSLHFQNSSLAGFW